MATPVQTDPRQTTGVMITDQAGGQIPSTPLPQVTQQSGGQSIDPATGLPTTTITPQNTLATKRLSYGVQATPVGQAGNVKDVTSAPTVGSIQAAFASQLPALNVDFARQADALSAKTAAMGRTGSGLYNRDTGYLGDYARAAREQLLGNLAFTATQNDANRALQANMGNQSAATSIAGMNTQRALADQANQMSVMQGQQAWGQYNQQREDALAQQAMNDQLQKLALQQFGFSYDPTGATQGAAGTIGNAAGMYGGNAGDINSQLQTMLTQGIPAVGGSPKENTPAVAPSTPYTHIPSSQLPKINLPSMPGFTLPNPVNDPYLDPFMLGSTQGSLGLPA